MSNGEFTMAGIFHYGLYFIIWWIILLDVELLDKVNVSLLPIVNTPVFIWIDYYHQFELYLTNLTNLLNEIT